MNPYEPKRNTATPADNHVRSDMDAEASPSDRHCMLPCDTKRFSAQFAELSMHANTDMITCEEICSWGHKY